MKMTFDEAQIYIDKLNVNSEKKWRLPDSNEARNLMIKAHSEIWTCEGDEDFRYVWSYTSARLRVKRDYYCHVIAVSD